MCLVLCLQKCCMYWVVQWNWFAQMNSLCNLSCKWSHQVSASFLGRFLSRCCFLLCIIMAVEHRIAKQYKCHYCCSCKNYQGKGWRVGKKCLCVIFFWLTRRLRICGKNAFGGILQHEQQVTACCQTHSDYGPPKISLKLAMKNSQIHCQRLPLQRKYAPEVKAAKGLKRCQAKVKGVNNPTWTTQ